MKTTTRDRLREKLAGRDPADLERGELTRLAGELDVTVERVRQLLAAGLLTVKSGVRLSGVVGKLDELLEGRNREDVAAAAGCSKRWLRFLNEPEERLTAKTIKRWAPPLAQVLGVSVEQVEFRLRRYWDTEQWLTEAAAP